MKKHFFVYSLVLSILAISIFGYMNFGKEKNIFEVKADGNSAGPIVGSNLFHDFFSWKKGNIKDFDPLYIFIGSQVTKTVSSTPTIAGTINYPKILTDVNGDGLVDLIYVDYSSEIKYDSTAGYNYTNYYNYYALLLNKGNLDFEATYRCVYFVGGGGSYLGKTGYYGDCAQ